MVHSFWFLLNTEMLGPSHAAFHCLKLVAQVGVVFGNSMECDFERRPALRTCSSYRVRTRTEHRARAVVHGPVLPAFLES
jgi:hypothetical protein